jgi:hypothetical protein
MSESCFISPSRLSQIRPCVGCAGPVVVRAAGTIGPHLRHATHTSASATAPPITTHIPPRRAQPTMVRGRVNGQAAGWLAHGAAPSKNLAAVHGRRFSFAWSCRSRRVRSMPTA